MYCFVEQGTHQSAVGTQNMQLVAPTHPKDAAVVQWMSTVVTSASLLTISGISLQQTHSNAVGCIAQCVH